MAEVAKKVVDKTKTNVKDRADSLKKRGREEVDLLKKAGRELVELKPVVAAVDVVAGTISTVGEFIKDQSLITRRWIERG
jgi:hypothetical protein